jgi:hypothetical protein
MEAVTVLDAIVALAVWPLGRGPVHSLPGPDAVEDDAWSIRRSGA